MARKAKEAPESKYIRATFMIREDLLEKLKDYCYTERITQKDALEKALCKMLDKVNDSDLLKKPKK